ncbi:MAG: 1-(5-phosphoribosyl)-5-[(5-phosphoribosylamino)methylideneamino]imidazole-4-carboxamide isomerase [Solirubrobacteraceae bacterium]
MILYPAIDILDGRAVRLVKGDFDASKVYDEDPLEAARAWVDGGAERLHVVDLDGARAGHPQNLDHLQRIASELGVPVQFGGGLRSLTAIEGAFARGVERVILGTAAFTDPELLGEALSRFGQGKVLVSVDVRDGRVATEGWTETIDGGAEEVIAQLWSRGAGELVYTNVDRDGMLGGPDLEEVRRVARAVQGTFLYSGGIGRLEDLYALAALGEPSLAGVIVGKALYEGRFTVAAARAALSG